MDNTGGYCSMCDTVWALPGKCRCKQLEPSTQKLVKALKGYWKCGCGLMHTQDYICTMLNKPEYDISFKGLGNKIAGKTLDNNDSKWGNYEKQPESVGITDKRSVVVKQNEKEHNKIWNAAIEAAALEYSKWTTENPNIVLDNFRKLKK